MHPARRFWGQTTLFSSQHHEKIHLEPICPFGDVTEAENTRSGFSVFVPRAPFLGSNNKYSISAPRKKWFWGEKLLFDSFRETRHSYGKLSNWIFQLGWVGVFQKFSRFSRF